MLLVFDLDIIDLFNNKRWRLLIKKVDIKLRVRLKFSGAKIGKSILQYTYRVLFTATAECEIANINYFNIFTFSDIETFHWIFVLYGMYHAWGEQWISYWNGEKGLDYYSTIRAVYVYEYYSLLLPGCFNE